jgi:hypothetical protein
MRQIKFQLLTDKIFILGLILLLTNDFFLKAEFAGPVTGKLSDISGLFIFPFFWSVFFEKQKLKIYILTACAFVMWKLPVTSGIINSFNDAFGTSFSRVIDYTDLLAMCVMPVSYWHLNRKLMSGENYSAVTVAPILIGSISLFAFVASSQPTKEVKPNMQIRKTFVVNVDKRELFEDILEPATGTSDNIDAAAVDSLFVIDFIHRGHNLRASVNVVSLGSKKTKIEFISLDSYTVTGKVFKGLDENRIKEIEDLKPEDYIQIFKVEVIENIEQGKTRESPIYFWNPKLDPQILE